MSYQIPAIQNECPHTELYPQTCGVACSACGKNFQNWPTTEHWLRWLDKKKAEVRKAVEIVSSVLRADAASFGSCGDTENAHRRTICADEIQKLLND